MTDYSDQYSNGSSKIVATYSLILMGCFLNLENGLPPLYISWNYDNIVICIIYYILFLMLNFSWTLEFFPFSGVNCIGTLTLFVCLCNLLIIFLYTYWKSLIIINKKIWNNQVNVNQPISIILLINKGTRLKLWKNYSTLFISYWIKITHASTWCVFHCPTCTLYHGIFSLFGFLDWVYV